MNLETWINNPQREHVQKQLKTRICKNIILAASIVYKTIYPFDAW